MPLAYVTVSPALFQLRLQYKRNGLQFKRKGFVWLVLDAHSGNSAAKQTHTTVLMSVLNKPRICLAGGTIRGTAGGEALGFHSRQRRHGKDAGLEDPFQILHEYKTQTSLQRSESQGCNERRTVRHNKSGYQGVERRSAVCPYEGAGEFDGRQPQVDNLGRRHRSDVD